MYREHVPRRQARPLGRPQDGHWGLAGLWGHWASIYGSPWWGGGCGWAGSHVPLRGLCSPKAASWRCMGREGQGACPPGPPQPFPTPFSPSVKLNEHFVNTTDFLDAIKNNLDKALGKK